MAKLGGGVGSSVGGPAGSGCLGRFQLCLPAVCGNPVSREPRICKVNSLALGLRATSRAGEGLSQGSRGGAPVEACSATAQGGLFSESAARLGPRLLEEVPFACWVGWNGCVSVSAPGAAA